MLALPQELVDKIAVELEADDLKRCSTISRAFGAACQRTLFSDISLAIVKSLQPVRLSQTFKASPHLARYVKVLHIQINGRSASPSRVPLLEDLFSRLTNVAILALVADIGLRLWKPMFTLLAKIPNAGLRKLSLRKIEFDTGVEFAALFARCDKLQELEIEQCCVHAKGDVAPSVATPRILPRALIMFIRGTDSELVSALQMVAAWQQLEVLGCTVAPEADFQGPLSGIAGAAPNLRIWSYTFAHQVQAVDLANLSQLSVVQLALILTHLPEDAANGTIGAVTTTLSSLPEPSALDLVAFIVFPDTQREQHRLRAWAEFDRALTSARFANVTRVDLRFTLQAQDDPLDLELYRQALPNLVQRGLLNVTQIWSRG
ncbi:hypothetical protein MKEN_00470700 [Mycena kentingensis (nom. inval.)]|nr:hypothetical protein MKEN_00470700 [Mycena kentingensis (nom. inval.)]